MNYAIIFLNFNNSYLPESRKKCSQELQRLALSSNSAGVHEFQFKQEKQQSVKSAQSKQGRHQNVRTFRTKQISQLVLVF